MILAWREFKLLLKTSSNFTTEIKNIYPAVLIVAHSQNLITNFSALKEQAELSIDATPHAKVFQQSD